MKLCKLVMLADHQSVYVNPALVRAIYPDKSGGVFIHFAFDDAIMVAGDLESIAYEIEIALR